MPGGRRCICRIDTQGVGDGAYVVQMSRGGDGAYAVQVPEDRIVPSFAVGKCIQHAMDDDDNRTKLGGSLLRQHMPLTCCVCFLVGDEILCQTVMRATSAASGQR